MATYFLDLDGVIFKHGTMEFNDGALEYLKEIKHQGHQIVFTTARKSSNNNVPSLQLDLTIQRLNEANIEYDSIIGNLSSPRIVVNDQGAFGINHKTDTPISHHQAPRDLRKRRNRPNAEKIHDALLCMAWTSRRHGGDKWIDADEYVQTIVIARSLLRKNGFDHADIVTSLRSDPCSNLKYLGPGGLAKNLLKKPNARKGAIWHLLDNGENEYVASEGFLDGAAMRTLPLAAFYGHDLEELVRFTNRASRITHSVIDARLAAILTALRFKQLLFSENKKIGELMENMRTAVEILGAQRYSGFFMERCKVAASIVSLNHCPEKCLTALIRNIGMKHFAWSTPICAVFWSFCVNGNYKHWLPPREKRGESDIYSTYNGELTIQSESGRPIHFSKALYADEMTKADSDHIKKIKNVNNDKLLGDERAMDVDTFFSIAFSLCAAEHGIEEIRSEAVSVSSMIFDDNLEKLSRQLSQSG